MLKDITNRGQSLRISRNYRFENGLSDFDLEANNELAKVDKFEAKKQKYMYIVDKLMNSNISFSDIAKNIGHGPSMITYLNTGRTKEIKYFYDGGFPIRPVGKDRDAAVERDVIAGMTVEEVAIKYDLAPKRVDLILRELGWGKWGDLRLPMGKTPNDL